MPIRWYGTGDTTDPRYRHFSRIVNFTLHAGAFVAVSSGLWFVQSMRHPWNHLGLFTEIWIAALLVHFTVVLKQRPIEDADSRES